MWRQRNVLVRVLALHIRSHITTKLIVKYSRKMLSLSANQRYFCTGIWLTEKTFSA